LKGDRFICTALNIQKPRYITQLPRLPDEVALGIPGIFQEDLQIREVLSYDPTILTFMSILFIRQLWYAQIAI
jgi:hypothetical protein